MASITIRDSLKAEIVSTRAASGLGKYFRGAAAELVAGAEFLKQLHEPLHQANSGENGLGFTFSNELPLGTEAMSLTLTAGSKATMILHNKAGAPLFERTFVGDPIKVAPGSTYLALSFRPRLALDKEQEVGSLTLGFAAGTEAEIRWYRPFDHGSDQLTLRQACTSLLESMLIPNTLEELKQMKDAPVGAIASLSGSGHLEVGGSVNIGAVLNPLASVNTIARLGRLDIGGARASASAGFRARLSGDFQVRVQKTAGTTIRLSFHRAAERALDITADASAAPVVMLDNRDLLKMIFAERSGPSEDMEEQLAASGIDSSQLNQIKSAMKAGMSRKLGLELSAAFSMLRENEAAFLYEVDLAALDAVSERALKKALAGDLSDLNALEPDLPGHGVRVLQSRLDRLRKNGVSWRVNLVGLVNVLSLNELARSAKVFHDEVSGELVIADKVSSERMGAVTEPKAVRKMLYEAAMMTATYKASGLDVNTSMTASQVFVHLDSRADRRRMSNYLDAVAAVGLIDEPDVERLLGSGTDFGRSSLVLETEFDQAACERLFDEDGTPRNEDAFESIGKRALLALVRDKDPDAYRRIPLRDVSLWARMKKTGQPGFRRILPPPITGGAAEQLRVAVVAADYTLIVWWARAMATAAERLAGLRTFLKNRDPAELDETDKSFRKRRTALENAMVKAVKQNKASFDDPWGLVALFMASRQAAKVCAKVVSPGLTLLLPDETAQR
jgi:hypothetical protein